jgi:hypothetical protein
MSDTLEFLLIWAACSAIIYHIAIRILIPDP